MSMEALDSTREVEMPGEQISCSVQPAGGEPLGPDADLVQQLRQGDCEAGRRFVRDYYPGVHRYLLYLTGRREMAEDLTQETFVQAWRRLEAFDNRAPLRPWLHRIAHREFLQALRSQHAESSLEDIPEAAAPQAGHATDEVELRAVLARLPLEARQVIVLHYLEGYSYQEIARIISAPVSTVKFRLAAARAALVRELGEGDLSYLNGAPEAVSVQNQPLFDALNRLSDTMGLRWNKEAGGNAGGAWLQFRSLTYYHDRLKEVPNRLLTRWSTARRQRGHLALEELVEIAALPNAQLDASSMAEGVREIWGLPEWDLARSGFVLANLRFLTQLTPAQREEVQSTRGLLFTRMTLAQQQAFFNRQLPGQPELHSLEELAGTALRVDYTQPGWFQWEPEIVSLRWATRPGPGREGKWLPVPAVRERTREAALQALRRIDPSIRAAAQATLQAFVDRGVIPAASLPPEEGQIVPAQLDLTTIYIPGTANRPLIYWRRGQQGVSDLD